MSDNSIEADAARYRHLRGKDVDTIYQGGVFAALCIKRTKRGVRDD